ncbi:hypothetical protein SAMN02744124_03283 [Paenibacillus barengoltzii J12]|uniref:Uncharacterized protein n=2 Tax=Paenibacillus barengoltzii TaxID=343517 RepID=R9L474_9BACL|nr:hypothetical protein C812_04185 [Paenibacillus barengoltzii G22]SMF20942.1 hypothetical protein SAMN02744102_01985 [Paenibacillus barengoltzii]SMF47967.1 hypothetical protein SAMN02744124_03283 [Paenibacillus barengoltzii J12]
MCMKNRIDSVEIAENGELYLIFRVHLHLLIAKTRRPPGWDGIPQAVFVL